MSESARQEETDARPSTGRYLYCLVDLDGNHPEQLRLDVAGIEGKSVSVVTTPAGSIGAIVHARDGPYDSTDLTELRDWLLAHQRVVEAAGDRFGTPLPVRFDTVLEGDDEAVTGWLARQADTIRDGFDPIAGCWEYRVTLSWDSTAFEGRQQTDDAELADLDGRIDQASEGTQFLLQKQYDQRIRELNRQRRETLTERLEDKLGEHSDQIAERPVQSETAAALDIDLRSDAIAQVAVLTAAENESELGATLEEFTDIEGVEIRFTGPWPPYTFAPTITGE